MKGIVALGLTSAWIASAAAGVHRIPIDTSDDRVESPLRVPLKRIGTLTPRSVYDVKASNWTIGCETLDRDFANFWEYAEFLEPLGIRRVRLQTGWAKTEKTKGVYDFAWLDRYVDFFVKRGYEIMLEPGYGNPLYAGSGGWDLGTGFPNTGDGLAAWDRYVTALVNHYRGRVREWAMWNEASNLWNHDPRLQATWNQKAQYEHTLRQSDQVFSGDAGVLPSESAEFCRHTSNLILGLQPEAKIACLTLGSTASCDPNGAYVEQALRTFGEDAKRYTWIIVHGYNRAPEAAERGIVKIRELIAKYAPNLRIRQGEQGCPSEFTSRFAMRNWPWSEYSQAKWDMRRMLFDLGLGIESHVFTISDFNHRGVFVDGINCKGLVRANVRRETIGVKRAYYAVQNVVSLFDDTLKLVEEPLLKTADATVRNYTYRKDDGRLVQLFWSYGEGVPYWTRQPEIKPKAPGDSFETRPIVLAGNVKPLKNPVWVDLFTGRVYAFPKKDWIADADGVTYMNVPAYDSPCVLTERSVVMDLPAPTRPVLEVFEATRREAEAENAARQERSALSDGVKPRAAADNLDI